LMGFPYRLIELFSHSPEVQAASLRLIDVALVVTSLVLMRKLLKLVKITDGLSNLIMLAFDLTPLLAVLSAQINYDDLLILAVTACAYQLVKFIQSLDSGGFDARALMILISLCLFSSLIKFAFLPIFVAIVLVLVWRLARYWPSDSKRLKAKAGKSFRGMGRS